MFLKKMYPLINLSIFISLVAGLKSHILLKNVDSLVKEALSIAFCLLKQFNINCNVKPSEKTSIESIIKFNTSL